MKPNAVKRLGMVQRKKSLTHEQFVHHWLNVHAELCKKLPGLIACRYSFAVEGMRGAEAPYYCVFEADFPDAATMVKALQSFRGIQLVTAAIIAAEPAARACPRLRGASEHSRPRSS